MGQKMNIEAYHQQQQVFLLEQQCASHMYISSAHLGELLFAKESTLSADHHKSLVLSVQRSYQTDPSSWPAQIQGRAINLAQLKMCIHNK
jgi:hypothetical protein